MADSSSLNVVLTANFRRLEQDLKQAGVIAERSVADIEDKFARANPRLNTSALLGGFVGGAISGAVTDLVDKIVGLPGKIIEANRELASLGDTARRVGLTTGELQATQFVGRQNGVTGEQSSQAMKGFASAIAGASQEGSKLGQLLADNGIRIADAAGKQRGLNDLLAEAARLIQGAGSEQEKVDMAKLLGLSEEWVRILEKGPEAFRSGQAMAVATGNVISTELINKAQAFDEVWSRSFGNFQTWAKSAAIEAASAFQKFLAVSNVVTDPTSLAQRQQEMLSQAQRAGGDSLKGQYFSRRAGEVGDLLEQQLAPELDRAKKALAVEMARQAEQAVSTANGTFKPGLYGGLIRPPKTNTTALNKSPTGGGGGGGLTDQERNYNDVVRYILQLEKTGRMLEAERATLGLSNAERAKALELARLGATPDAEQLAIIEKQLAANEANRQAIEKTNLAIKGTRDAAQFAGDQIANAFDSLLDGGKIEDAINGITKALMKAAIQAALLGQGPLAGLLGTAGGSATGGIGGIIGSLLPARASGGPVQSGKTYLVGENGPEMVRFGKNGTVMPNGVLGGSRGASGAPVNVSVVNNTPAGVGVQETQGPGGARQIQILVDQALAQAVNKNTPGAQAFQSRYGLSRTAGRR